MRELRTSGSVGALGSDPWGHPMFSKLLGGGGERAAANYDTFEPAPSDVSGEVYVPSGDELSDLAKKCGW